MADAVGSAFFDAVARTSLVGAVIRDIGTVLVAVPLPRREAGAEEEEELAECGSRCPFRTSIH